MRTVAADLLRERHVEVDGASGQSCDLSLGFLNQRVGRRDRDVLLGEGKRKHIPPVDDLSGDQNRRSQVFLVEICDGNMGLRRVA